ncbi:MAG: hypothetical protein U0441_07185 [Polyangiaceae bacterium]
MASEDDPKVLLWSVLTPGEDGPRVLDALDIEQWPAESRLAVRGAPGAWKYIYVAEDDVSRLVTVLVELRVEEAGLPPEAEVRVPQEGAWLWMRSAGNIRVLGSPRILSRAEIAEAFGGHSPPPTGTTTDPRVSPEDE